MMHRHHAIWRNAFIVNGLFVKNEGDWESGYYDVHICPNCGEIIDEYDMSPDCMARYDKWYEKTHLGDGV